MLARENINRLAEVADNGQIIIGSPNVFIKGRLVARIASKISIVILSAENATCIIADGVLSNEGKVLLIAEGVLIQSYTHTRVIKVALNQSA